MTSMDDNARPLCKRICSVLNKDGFMTESRMEYETKELLSIFYDYYKEIIEKYGIDPLMFDDVVLVKKEVQPDNFQNYFANYLKNKYSVYIVVRKIKSYSTRHSDNYVFSLKSQNFYAYSDSEGNFTLAEC
jgi:putative aminopeptidase FrvX